MKKFQLLKWTAEVRENGHTFDSIDLLKDNDPTVILETDSESEAYDCLETESELLCIHIFNNCGLNFAEVDCLLLREVEFDEDGDVVNCEYMDIRYPEKN